MPVPFQTKLGLGFAAGQLASVGWNMYVYVCCSSDIYHFDIYAMGPWGHSYLGRQQQRYKLTLERESTILSGRWQAINAQQQMENN